MLAGWTSCPVVASSESCRPSTTPATSPARPAWRRIGSRYFAFLHFFIFANLLTGASMACNWVSVEAWERERGRGIPAYLIFGRISSPINCILIVRIKANFSVVRGLINFAPEDNGCQEMCRLTKFLEKARHLLAVQPILPKSLRRTLFFRGNFLLHPSKHEENFSCCHSPWIDIGT